MKITYNTLNDIADFDTQKMKEGYEETFYAVFFLDYQFHHIWYNGFGRSTDIYKKGFYVIPVRLVAKRWICGDKVVMKVVHDTLGICGKFKPYYGIGDELIGRHGPEQYVDNKELYDDPDEAIARAKELDKLMNIIDKINKTVKKIVYHKHLLENLQFKMWMYREKTWGKTKRQELEYQLDELALENRKSLIKKLDEQRDSLYKKKEKYQEFSPGR